MKKLILAAIAAVLTMIGLVAFSSSAAATSSFPKTAVVSWQMPDGGSGSHITWPQSLYSTEGDTPECTETGEVTFQVDTYHLENQVFEDYLHQLEDHGVLNQPGSGSWTDSQIYQSANFVTPPKCEDETTTSETTTSSSTTTSSTSDTSSTSSTSSTTSSTESTSSSSSTVKTTPTTPTTSSTSTTSSSTKTTPSVPTTPTTSSTSSTVKTTPKTSKPVVVPPATNTTPVKTTPVVTTPVVTSKITKPVIVSTTATKTSPYYANCKEVEKAGISLVRGQPGYRPELDYNGNGKACDVLPSTVTSTTTSEQFVVVPQDSTGQVVYTPVGAADTGGGSLAYTGTSTSLLVWGIAAVVLALVGSAILYATRQRKGTHQ